MCFGRLLLNVGQKPHKSRSLDGRFYCTLLLGGKSAFAARHDAAVGIDELLQEIHVFVINVLDIVLRENVVGHTLFKTEYHQD